MSKLTKDSILIDGLEYCNWDRDLFENAHQSGITAIHVTLVYWENTQEAFEKIKYWNNLIEKHYDLITQVKSTNDIINAKKITKLELSMVFKTLHR